MQIDPDIPIVAADDFARRFSMRGSRLMWFLGAGASAAAGIPTAWDMIQEFKQRLYVSQKQVSPKIVADLASPIVQRELQDFIDREGKYPPTGAPEEYASLFEAVFASEDDRQTYIDGKLSGAKPSYGHIALATLMQADYARIAWTTNFDPLIADGCAKVYGGTGHLTTVALENVELGRQVLDNERWPLEVKLHGDFRSRRLKNTADELREQDAGLRDLLADACRRWGLVVAGYSGRDDSVMNALEKALERPYAFPAGLFWLQRGSAQPLPRVTQLLTKASSRGVEVGLVQIESFDEILRDLVRLLDGLDTRALDAFAEHRRIWSPAPRPSGQRGFPVLRLNALELSGRPSVCRRIVCNIGGSAEVAEAIAAADVNVLAARSKAGVLAFGSDADVRTAFSDFGIRTFDLHSIETRRLRYDSQERGLLRRCLGIALARGRDMTLIRRRSADLLVPSAPDAPRWLPLRKIAGKLHGTVPGASEISWTEGVAVRLDWADDRLWLLFEPRTVFDGVTHANRSRAADFGRERTARRYNRDLNSFMTFWAETISGDGTPLYALGTSAGVEAAFEVSSDTAFSRRTNR